MNITRTIESNYPRNAYNNSVISFTEGNAIKASIVISGNTFYITPFAASFFFNFKEVVKVLMNTNFFADKVITGNGFITDDYAFKKYPVTVKTYNANNAVIDTWNFNAKFLKSALQIEEEQKERIILHEDFNDEYYFDIWEGLPFHITLFKNVYPFTLEVSTKVKVSDIIIGDGEIDLRGIPIHSWHWETKFFDLTDESDVEKAVRFYFINNNGELMQQNIEDNKLILNPEVTSDLKIIHGDSTIASGKINYHKNCDSGIYLKWFNIYGGWDFHLFTDKFKINPKIKSLGEAFTGFDNYNIQSGNQNIQLMTGFTSEFGKSADISFDIEESFLDEIRFKKISKIVYSPRVCLWTGTKWIDVQIDSKLKYNNKKPFGKLEFNLTLPERVLQTV